MFFLKKLLATLILPPTGPLLLVAAGLLLQRARRRGLRSFGLALAWGGIALLFALSLPLVSRALTNSLSPETLSAAAAREAQAIVVLAGGIRHNAPEFGGASTPNDRSLIRLHYGAYLQRQTGLPLLLSGGAPTGREAEAVAMARTLREDYGLSARWIEDESLDTQGNAERSAALLAAADIHTILLVTERYHMRRAQAEFERAGIKAIPAATGFGGDDLPADAGDETPLFFAIVPSQLDFYRSLLALHEWLGILALRLR